LLVKVLNLRLKIKLRCLEIENRGSIFYVYQYSIRYFLFTTVKYSKMDILYINYCFTNYSLCPYICSEKTFGLALPLWVHELTFGDFYESSASHVVD
jgi:hypothetical protein